LAIFPKDISSPPKEFAGRFFNIVQWTEMPKGGHFAAMEQPELLAEDIRKFVTYLQNKTQLKGSLEKVMEN
jgi:pimeloyl-ACP methyl ester carboxylesterase